MSKDLSVEHLYILGHPVAHSKSPVMYNALYPELGLSWKYDFADMDTADEARSFLERRAFLSVNVTTPYKPEAFKAAQIKAASAKLARGVNLLVNKDGTLLGYNVDGLGCIRFLEREGVAFADKKIAVCGTGPTAMSILHAAAQAGAEEVLLLGRDRERTRSTMERYVEEFRHLASTAIPMPAPSEGHLGFAEAYEHVNFKFGTYETSKKGIAAADVIVDATVLGMNPGDPSPFDTSLLRPDHIVMDTVYGHGESALIAAAREVGCKAFDGAGMLVSQAVLTAIILCEVEGVSLEWGYNTMFDIMAKAAGFDV